MVRTVSSAWLLVMAFWCLGDAPASSAATNLAAAAGTFFMVDSHAAHNSRSHKQPEAQLAGTLIDRACVPGANPHRLCSQRQYGRHAAPVEHTSRCSKTRSVS